METRRREKVSTKSKAIGRYGLGFILVALGLTLVLILGVRIYSEYYTKSVVPERERLYKQAEVLRKDFDEVYGMDNADVKIAKNVSVTLTTKRFSLILTFDDNREDIMTIREVRNIDWAVIVAVVLLIAFAIVLAFVMGRITASYFPSKERETKKLECDAEQDE